MKVFLKVAFLLFYVASSYAITQERTAVIVQEFEHTSSRDDQTRIEEDCQRLQDSFPRYRHAKPKPGIDFCPHDAQTATPQLDVSTGDFAPQAVSFKSIFSLVSVPSRASPVQL